MPLEQISRPFLSLKPRSSSSRVEKSTRSRSPSPSSTGGPPSPQDGFDTSTLVGPASPGVRSTKSLLGDSSDYNSHYPNSYDHLSPSRPSTSSDATSTSSSATMDLSKLGAVGGVHRSASWKSGGISVIGRGHSYDLSTSRDRDGGHDDAGDDNAIGRSTSLRSFRTDGRPSLDDDHELSSSSRASTSGSQSSYSAAAFSLRSLSDRSSARSSISSSALHNGSPLASMQTLPGDEPKLSRNKSDATHDASRLKTLASRADEGHEDDLKRSKSFVGPGVSRIKSIGRGSGGDHLQGNDNPVVPPRTASRPSLLVEQENEPQPPVASPLPATSPAQETQMEADTTADNLPMTESPDTGLGQTGSASASESALAAAPAATAMASAPSPRAADIEAPLYAHPSPPPPPPTFSAGTSLQAPAPQPSQASHVHALSPKSSPKGWNRRTSAYQSPTLNPNIASHATSTDPRWEPYSVPPWTSMPMSANASSSASATPYSPGPPPPRRHTGGLRSRSALNQQTAGYNNGGSGSTSFYGVGEEGGRRAARARARHPSLANLDNAPFSVLEQLRSQGVRPPATSATPGVSSALRSPRLDELSNSGPLDGVPVPSRPQGGGSPRPLSPIAHASPDAQWSLASVNVGPEPFGFASMASLHDLDEGQGLSEGGDETLAVPAPGHSLLEPPPLIPVSNAGQQERIPSSFATHSQPVSGGANGSSSPSPASSHKRPSLNLIDVLRWRSPDSAASSGSSNREDSPAGQHSASSPTPSDGIPAMLRRPSLVRATASATNLPSLSHQNAAPVPVSSPPPSAKHVLRTPTTEEWARYLASQGLEPGRQVPRTRSTTSKSLAGLASHRRGSIADRILGTSEDISVGSASPGKDVAGTPDLQEQLYSIQPGMRSAAAASYGSLAEALNDDRGRWAEGSSRSRSSSSSSDSSQGRMEALHAAISMPPSRRGTPPPLQAAYGGSPMSPRQLPTLEGDDQATTPIGPSRTGLLGPTPRRDAPAMSHTQVQQMHGYPPSSTGHKRSIDDFVILQDVGRGAYGLVKLVRLKGGPSGEEPIGPEFVVKYIIKSRILADCWRRHRILGPIPVEIHVMDQLRRLAYQVPERPPPWSPEYLWQNAGSPQAQEEMSPPPTPATLTNVSPPYSLASTPMQTPRAAVTEVTADSEDEAEGKHTLSMNVQTHPSLCTMLDFFEDESFYYLVMPRFGQGSDLFDYIESRPYGLKTSEARCILGQVADGIQFLHEHGIVHRDIKDENVILDGSGHAQLIDFGSAAHVRPGRLFDTFSGTLDYAAAEILRGDKYAGKEQDVWAMGVVAYVCLVGDAPFWNGEEAMRGLEPGSRAMIALEERCGMEVVPPQPAAGEEEHPEPTPAELAELKRQRCEDLAGQRDGGGRLEDAKDFVENCLMLEPEDRPSATDVVRHVFLSGSSPDSWRGPRGWERTVDGRKGGPVGELDAEPLAVKPMSYEGADETLC